MIELFQRTSTRYFVAVLIGLVATWVVTITPVTGNNSVLLVVSLTSLVAVILVGGFGPTVVASTPPLLATLWYLIPPIGSFAIADRMTMWRVVLTYIAVAGAGWLEYVARREKGRLRRREQELLHSEGRYRMLLLRASDAVLVFDRDLRVELASERAATLLGRVPGTLVGLSYADVFGRDAPAAAPGDASAPWREEATIRRGDGSVLTGELGTSLLPNGGLQVIVRDITARVRESDALREERDLLDGVLDTSEAALVVAEVPSRRIRFVNRRFEEFSGHPRESLIGQPFDILQWEYATLDFTPITGEQLPSYAVVEHGATVRDERVLLRARGGAWRTVTTNIGPLHHADGTTRGIVISLQDISERRATEEALRSSEARLRRLTDAVPGIVYQYQLLAGGRQRFTFASAGVNDVLGLTTEEVLGDFSRVWDLMVPEDRDRVTRSIAESAMHGTQWTEEFQVRLANGTRKWLQGTALPQPPDAEGNIQWDGLFTDITDRKRLETDLLQAQKMESIGRLAGGIAHDFNNILTAIRGNVDLLLEEVNDEHAFWHELRDIRDAAERASSLTRQLLAFSRKQAMQVRDLDVAALVRDMEKMLRRVIGEDVVLLTQPAESGSLVRADPGQLEQVLLNLAVNARDAMPEGGLLTIETRNVRVDGALAASLGLTAGDYVSLVVRDTGHGMNAETQARIFEPFFTTKPAGRGTGLGLAMVYGTVRQSGGAITVESEIGRGATFRLYFPRAVATADRLPIITPPDTPIITGRREATILLVEDDAAVRTLTRRILEDAGFTVRPACDAYEALTLAGDACQGIDLVVSDVIMPGVSGRELARELRTRREDLRILFISGYLDIDVPRLGLSRTTRLLSKPFTRESLLRHVHQLLDERPALAGDPA